MSGDDLPFFAVSNDELEKLPVLSAGQLIDCDRCGKQHKVRDGDPPGVLQAIRCNGQTYLVGIKGRRIK
jgi:hypothetical protein